MLAGGLILVGVYGSALAAAVACRPPATPSAYRPDALYRRYCASCHGLAGKGDGPVSEVLKVQPPDLTRLAAQYGGEDLVDTIQQAIDGRRAIRAHGEKGLPVWGEFFAEEFLGDRISDRPRFPKAFDIAKYVATQMQEPTGGGR